MDVKGFIFIRGCLGALDAPWLFFAAVTSAAPQGDRELPYLADKDLCPLGDLGVLNHRCLVF